MNWLLVALTPLWLSCWSCPAQFVGVRAERQAGARRERTRQANSTGNGEDPQAKPAFVLRPTCSPPLTFEPQIHTHQMQSM